MLKKSHLAPLYVTSIGSNLFASSAPSDELIQVADLLRSVPAEQQQEIKDILSMFLLRDAFSCSVIDHSLNNIQ